MKFDFSELYISTLVNQRDEEDYEQQQVHQPWNDERFCETFFVLLEETSDSPSLFMSIKEPVALMVKNSNMSLQGHKLLKVNELLEY